MVTCLVWHFGGRIINGVYVGGDKYGQVIDTDRLGYWCLVEHAKVDLKQTGTFKLYFRKRDSAELVLIYDDATTCQLLSILNKKKDVDIYVVNDNTTDGASGSQSVPDIGKDNWNFFNFLNDTEIHELYKECEVGEVGEVHVTKVNEKYLEEELNEGEEEYIEVNA